MRSLVIFAASLFLLAAVQVEAQIISDPNDLCTGDPCIIPSGTFLIADSAILDFGARDVILEGTLRTVDSVNAMMIVVDAGTINIFAKSMTFGLGGRIDAQGSSTLEGGTIDIFTDDDINVTNNDNVPPPLQASGAPGGSISLESGSGSVFVEGKIDVSSISSDESGGTLTVVAAGEIQLNGKVDGHGGSAGAGSESSLPDGLDATAGPIFVNDVDFSGGEDGGGFLDVTCSGSGSVTLGLIDLSATGLGDGGDLTVTAEADVIFTGILRTMDGQADGGLAGSLEVITEENSTVFIFDELQLQGRGAGAAAGTVDISGDTVNIQNDIQMGRTTPDGTAGSVDIFATRDINLTTNGRILIEPGTGGGGSIDFTADGSIAMNGTIDGDATGILGIGADISLDAENTLSVGGSIDVRGSNGGRPGNITMSACLVDMAAASSILMTEPNAIGLFDLTIREDGSIAGSITADPTSGMVNIFYRNTAPDLTGSTITPAPNLILNPNIPSCDDDNDGILNFDDNCPFFANAGQADSNGDGIGTVCQCGDVNGDGFVNQTDADGVKLALAQVSSIAGPRKCNVTGPVDGDTWDVFNIAPDCKVDDWAVLERNANGLIPFIPQSCRNAVP